MGKERKNMVTKVTIKCDNLFIQYTFIDYSVEATVVDVWSKKVLR